MTLIIIIAHSLFFIKHSEGRGVEGRGLACRAWWCLIEGRYCFGRVRMSEPQSGALVFAFCLCAGAWLMGCIIFIYCYS